MDSIQVKPKPRPARKPKYARKGSLKVKGKCPLCKSYLANLESRKVQPELVPNPEVKDILSPPVQSSMEAADEKSDVVQDLGIDLNQNHDFELTKEGETLKEKEEEDVNDAELKNEGDAPSPSACASANQEDVPTQAATSCVYESNLQSEDNGSPVTDCDTN